MQKEFIATSVLKKNILTTLNSNFKQNKNKKNTYKPNAKRNKRKVNEKLKKFDMELFMCPLAN